MYSKLIAKDGKKILMLISIHVDDVIHASNNSNMLVQEKLKLSQNFEMEDQGEIHYCLGMSIKRDRDAKVLTIDQKAYLESVLTRFGMSECKPVSMPMEAGKRFEKLDNNEHPVNIREYQIAIGSLIYASIAIRSDLSFSVGALNQFMSNPSKEHWSGVKRVLRYIKGMIDYGLKFEASNHDQIELCSYADWAGDVVTRKSTSGYVFQIGKSMISWRSNRQSVIALSSTEAEYISLFTGTQEVTWLSRMLCSVGFKQQITYYDV